MINESFITGFVAGLVVAVLLFVVLGIGFVIVRPWTQLVLRSGRASLIHVLAMQLRGTPPQLIVDAYTSLLHTGEQVSLHEVESQYIANRTRILNAAELIEHMREYNRRQTLADADDR